MDKSPERTRDVEVVASCAFFVVHLGFVDFAFVEELAEDFGHIFFNLNETKNTIPLYTFKYKAIPNLMCAPLKLQTLNT